MTTSPPGSSRLPWRGSRLSWRGMLPWIAALALFAVAVPSVPEVLDVEAVSGWLLPVAAGAAALPFGLIRSRPGLGWAISATSALLVSRAFPVLDGDPWQFPIVHGLVLLALLFAVTARRADAGHRVTHASMAVLATGATIVAFAISVPAALRPGWIVGVTAVAVSGIVVGRLPPGRRDASPPTADTDLTFGDVAEALAGGFREAFIAWVNSPPLLRTLREILVQRWGAQSWVRWVPGLPWWPAVVVFWISLETIPATLVMHDLARPFLAAVIALPVALTASRALIGWRVVTVVAVVLAVVGTPVGGPGAVAWPVVLQWVWLLMILLVALRHDRWTTVWVWAASIAVISTGVADDPGVSTTLGVTTTVLAVIGDLVRTRRQTSRALEKQTELSELEAARRTVLEERARIARELHDVVAHHMSMVVVQAESAPYRLAGLSPDAEAEFASISGSARQALTEIRALLGVLRSDDHDLTRAPQPGLDQLDSLVAGARRSGLPVQLRVTGTPRPTSAAVELSAYRIVQESLANAARHAPGAPVIVTVDHGGDALDLLVANDASITGPPTATPSDPPAPVPGHGLTGMRERAAVAGGTLRAGTRGDGGFEVEARLPYPGEATP